MQKSSEFRGGAAVVDDRAGADATRPGPASQVIARFGARPQAMRLTVVTLLSLGIWALIAKGVVAAVG